MPSLRAPGNRPPGGRPGPLTLVLPDTGFDSGARCPGAIWPGTTRTSALLYPAPSRRGAQRTAPRRRRGGTLLPRAISTPRSAATTSCQRLPTPALSHSFPASSTLADQHAWYIVRRSRLPVLYFDTAKSGGALLSRVSAERCLHAAGPCVGPRGPHVPSGTLTRPEWYHDYPR